MEVLLHLSDTEKNNWILRYQEELLELDKRREEIIILLSELGVDINVSANSAVEVSSSKLPKLHWGKVSISYLRKADRLLSTNDLYESFLLEFPNFQEFERSLIISKISSSLSQLRRKETIRKVDNPIEKGNLWALDSWFSGAILKYQYGVEFMERTGISVGPTTPPPSQVDDLPF